MSAQGKGVLVIGGETVVGRALAVGLAEAGADVAIASLSKDSEAEFAINSLLNELWAIGRRGLALVMDASDAAQVRDAIARAETELGGVDAVVVVGDTAAKEALDDRNEIVVTADAEASDALRLVIDRLGRE